MAQSLMLNTASRLLMRVVLFVGSLLLVPATAAQNIADPTRPPAAMSIDASANSEALAGPILQSILIAPNRHVAIINGQPIALNGKYGDQTLIKMTETEVVLRNGKEIQILKLFPDFDKKSSRVGTK